MSSGASLGSLDGAAKGSFGCFTERAWRTANMK